MDDEESSSVLGKWVRKFEGTTKSAKAYRQILFAIFFQLVLYNFMELEDTTTISKVHKHVRHFLQDPSAACIDGDAEHARLYGGFPKEECVLWSEIHSWRAMSTCGAPRRARARASAPARCPSRPFPEPPNARRPLRRAPRAFG